MFGKVRGVKDNFVLILAFLYLLFFEGILGWATYKTFNQSGEILNLIMPVLTAPVMMLLLLGILNIILPEQRYREVIAFLGWILQLFKKGSRVLEPAE